MGNTSIQWTDKTWNPTRGCSMAKGSETGGCLNCYAARMAARNLPELKSPTTGQSFARILESGPRWTGEVELIESQLTLPLKWKQPKRIFVNSMSDLFHESLPWSQIDRVFAVMSQCPQHTFQILTKRAENMRQYLDLTQRSAIRGGGSFAEKLPFSNVWLGVSIENQATADARIPLLLKTPAAVRFVSYEPALGPVDFNATPPKPGVYPINGATVADISGCLPKWQTSPMRAKLSNGIDWLIIGGESGPGARPFDIAWARQTIEQCKHAGVPCFVKQFGARPMSSDSSDWIGHRGGIGPTGNGLEERWFIHLKDRKGGCMDEWPMDLRVRQFPEVPHA